MVVSRRPARACFAMLRVLLVAVLLLTRMMAPAMAMASPQADDPFRGDAICHAMASEPTAPAHGSPAPHDNGDCGLCPVCHLTATPDLVSPGPVFVAAAVAGRAAVRVVPRGDVRRFAQVWTPSRPRGPPVRVL